MLWFIPFLLLILLFYVYETTTRTHLRWYWGVVGMIAVNIILAYWTLLVDWFQPQQVAQTPRESHLY